MVTSIAIVFMKRTRSSSPTSTSTQRSSTDDAADAADEEAVDVDALLREADACRELAFGPPDVDHTDRSVVVFLSTGEPHVCSKSCKHIVLTSRDKSYVCKVSGLTWGCLALRDTISTGRTTGSNAIRTYRR